MKNYLSDDKLDILIGKLNKKDLMDSIDNILQENNNALKKTI